MKESRAKQGSGTRKTGLLLTATFLAGLAVSSYAQDQSDLSVPPDRSASFLTAPLKDTVAPSFSGLATTTPIPVTPPAADLIAPPVTAAPLTDVSPLSVGAQNADSLGADMWKGTLYATAETLLSIATPTTSPTLNNLTRRLLTTAAAPPEGEATKGTPNLITLRVGKLLNFGAEPEAWALAKQADAPLIDDITFHAVAEQALAADDKEICGSLPQWVKNRATVDWQQAQIICQLRDKNTKAAQVALDVLRTQETRDNLFLEIADKNIIGDSKALPHRLTALTPATLALLRLTDLPLSGGLYLHADAALTPALLQTRAQMDVSQLTLAERAAERGLIDSATLEALYRTISFSPDALAAPLTTNESSMRLRALLFRAAMDEKDAKKRIAYTIKFVQSTAPALLNGANRIAADMLGDLKPETSTADNAVLITWIYMNAGRGDAALDWLRLARQTPANADSLQKLWPQLALAGLESENDLSDHLNKWLNAASNPSASLLLLDAAGLTIPDSAWSKLLTAPHTEKRIALSSVLFDRLQSAGTAKKRAETVLLAAALANDAEISLPAAVAITRALRLAGFKNEAAIFARQQIALLALGN